MHCSLFGYVKNVSYCRLKTSARATAAETAPTETSSSEGASAETSPESPVKWPGDGWKAAEPRAVVPRLVMESVKRFAAVRATVCFFVMFYHLEPVNRDFGIDTADS